MSSSDITFDEWKRWMDRGWSDWLPLDKDAIKTVPQLPGVYEIRIKEYSFPRLQGQTSTIYIGSAEKRELAKRLNSLVRERYARGGRGDRIAKVRIGLQRELEFRFRVESAAKKVEGELLAEYCGRHLELPPCNHSLPREAS